MPYIKPLRATVVINPHIQKASKEVASGWEGCLSCRNIRGLVKRHKWVEVFYYDQSGLPKTKRFEGFHARVLQHEIDHLNGILFIDKAENIHDHDKK